MNIKRGMFTKEYLWRTIVTLCGLFVIVLTLGIGGFLVYKGSGTFLKFNHSIGEFLFSPDWAPIDNMEGGGSVGTLIFIVGSLSTCGLALFIATPFALGSAIFMTEISPKFGEKFYRPVIQIFAGIPSVVYGWVGLTVLVPFIRDMFHRQVGHSILAAGIVLAIMIFPTITSVSADAIRSVPKDYRMGAYGQTTALPDSIFSTTKSLTTEITAQMGNAMEGGETKTALWTLALLLFLISLLFIFLIHFLSAKQSEESGNKKKGAKTN